MTIADWQQATGAMHRGKSAAISLSRGNIRPLVVTDYQRHLPQLWTEAADQIAIESRNSEQVNSAVPAPHPRPETTPQASPLSLESPGSPGEQTNVHRPPPHVCQGDLGSHYGALGSASELLPAMPNPTRTLVVTSYNGGRILRREAAESAVDRSALRGYFPPGGILEAEKQRSTRGIVWSALTVPRQMSFAVAFDGSSAWRELLWEHVVATAHGGNVVGLYTCAQQMVGALFMARSLMAHCDKSTRMWLMFALGGIGGYRLALDTHDTPYAGTRPVGGADEERIVIGGDFPPDVSDDEIQTSSSELLQALVWHFNADSLNDAVRHAVKTVCERAQI